MQLSTRGIVLKEQPVGESGKLIIILTETYGIVRAFAHGARKSSSRLLAGCSLFSYSQFVLNSSKDAYTVTSAENLAMFHALRTDVEKLALTSYFSELCGFVVPTDSSSGQFLRLFLNCIHFLSNRPLSPIAVKAVFELKSMEFAGYMPSLVGCCYCGEYMGEKMFYLPHSGSLCCGNCVGKSSGQPCILLTRGALTAMRYIVFTELEKVFRFSLSSESLQILGRVTESYVLSTLERGFPTLDFYHSLTKG